MLFTSLKNGIDRNFIHSNSNCTFVVFCSTTNLTALYWFKINDRPFSLEITFKPIKYFRYFNFICCDGVFRFIVDKLLPPLLIAGLILLQCKLHLVNWDKKRSEFMAK
jgi:hypothetical protein